MRFYLQRVDMAGVLHTFPCYFNLSYPDFNIGFGKEIEICLNNGLANKVYELSGTVIKLVIEQYGIHIIDCYINVVDDDSNTFHRDAFTIYFDNPA
jgi:hypothetical protein